MTRREHIDRIVNNLDNRGSASGEKACGPALAELFRSALAEEDAHSKKTGQPPLDPRKVLIGIMTNMRQAMTEVRDELDALDGVGKYK